MYFHRMKSFIFSIAFLFALSPRLTFAQAPPVATFKLFLIGDAGEGDTTGATLHDLHVMLMDNPNSAVVFLGDNCYKKSLFGLIKLEVGGFDGSRTARRRIMAQLEILRGYKGSAFFIPGNHDWFNHINLKRGMKRLMDEQVFIEDSLKNFKSLKNHKEGTFLPRNGSPGPISLDFNDGKTRIIFIDSYRLIIEEGRKRKNDRILLNEFYSNLKMQLNDATSKRQKIIVVAHHPIHAKGKHSIPLVLAERINRRFADANTNYPPYRKMSERLDSLLKAHHHPDIYYVSGHEHSLEYFFTDSLHYIISGAGSRVDQVNQESCMDNEECLQWNEEGFFEIDFYGRYETVRMFHRPSYNVKLRTECLSGCN